MVTLMQLTSTCVSLLKGFFFFPLLDLGLFKVYNIFISFTEKVIFLLKNLELCAAPLNMDLVHVGKINQQFNAPVNSLIARWVKFHEEIRPVPIQYKKLIQDGQMFPVLLAIRLQFLKASWECTGTPLSAVYKRLSCSQQQCYQCMWSINLCLFNQSKYTYQTMQ